LSEACANCGTVLSGRFCAGCGQVARAQLTFRELAGQVVEGLLNLDSRLWLTLRDLAVPGRLTTAYSSGRRARYMPPVQTYLVVALVFFALAPSGLEAVMANLALRPYIAREAQAAGVTQEAYVEERLRDDGVPTRTLAFQTGVSRFSLLMFVTMPVLALILQGLHHSRRRDHLEHLLLAIHLQTVMFVLGSLALLTEIAVLARWLPSVSGVLWPSLGVLVLTYGVLALWRVYGEAWWVAATKAAIAVVAYGSLLVITASAVARFG